MLIMLEARSIVREARRFLSWAAPLYIVNVLIVPILILAGPRIGLEVQLLLLPLILYESLALASLIALFAGRRELLEYSLNTAGRLLLFAGVCGLFTGLVAGGILVLKAVGTVKRAR